MTFVLFWVNSAFAQKTGDRIVVTANGADLKSQNEIVTRVPKGQILTVKDLKEESFHVIYSERKKKQKSGWINRHEVISFEKCALDFFNDELDRNPDAEMYMGRLRGAFWIHMEKLDSAIKDLSEALRRDPSSVHAWNRRGAAWAQKGDADKAVADFNEAIRVDPNFTRAYSNRGMIAFRKGDLD